MKPHFFNNVVFLPGSALSPSAGNYSQLRFRSGCFWGLSKCSTSGWSEKSRGWDEPKDWRGLSNIGSEDWPVLRTVDICLIYRLRSSVDRRQKLDLKTDEPGGHWTNLIQRLRSPEDRRQEVDLKIDKFWGQETGVWFKTSRVLRTGDESLIYRLTSPEDRRHVWFKDWRLLSTEFKKN